MEETDHLHITFIRSAEMQQYKKNWPNHVFLVLPDEFDESSDAAVKNIMQVRFFEIGPHFTSSLWSMNWKLRKRTVFSFCEVWKIRILPF